MRLAGVDLSAKESRPSGIAWLDEGEVFVKEAFSNEEIVDLLMEVSPRVVAIDAPLSLPLGRCCLRKECNCERIGGMRWIEREMISRGYRVFPVTFKWMRNLTERGISLKKNLEKRGIEVIEVHPGTSRKILGPLWELLPKINLRIQKKDLSRDEEDAVYSAITAFMYFLGEFETLGREDEGLIVLPLPIRK
ncbi:DUF429 domain-containing protein [Thermococci archaeon]|mgnify:CR=1 FL=1|nr:MAG: DUF429 domain-containing protein [Thermococci archaeon]RLF95055.1 MAG: DUF429 domain-containing protein [Thermococci archaeon]